MSITDDIREDTTVETTFHGPVTTPPDDLLTAWEGYQRAAVRWREHRTEAAYQGRLGTRRSSKAPPLRVYAERTALLQAEAEAARLEYGRVVGRYIRFSIGINADAPLDNRSLRDQAAGDSE